MPAVPTGVSEIDRKLHRVIMESNPTEFTNMMGLARSMAKVKHREFSYTRARKTKYSSADTIQSYISYARTVGLLDGNLSPTRPKGDVRTLENFQQWLSDTVVQYLADNNSAITRVEDEIRGMLQGVTIELPTQDNVYSRLQNPPPRQVFQMSLRIISRLRPIALRVRSRRIILIPGLIED